MLSVHIELIVVNGHGLILLVDPADQLWKEDRPFLAGIPSYQKQ